MSDLYVERLSVSKILFLICPVDNEQVRKPAISEVFVCKHWKEIVGLPLGELEGNRENFPSWTGKRDCGCLPLTIVFVENGGKAKYIRVLARILTWSIGILQKFQYEHLVKWFIPWLHFTRALRVFTQVIIAIERRRAIVTPLKPRYWRSGIVTMLCSCWLLSETFPWT